MKKLLAILISLCMVSSFAVPVFADANSDYIAAVKHAPEAVKNFLQEIMQKQMQEFNRRARERKNNREER